MTHNDYPRAVLLEAAIRFVQEDLRLAPPPVSGGGG